MNQKVRITLLLVLAAVVMVVGIKVYKNKQAKAVDFIAARTKGNPQAKVKVIEFIDLQCPACARGTKVLREYMDKHPQDIHLQLRFFPLTRAHRHAMSSALYAQCAAMQNKFWPFVESILEQQPQWSELLSADPIFVQTANASVLDMAALNACMATEQAVQAVKDDQTLGQSLGVQSTPTYFVNNKMVVGVNDLTKELNSYFTAP